MLIPPERIGRRSLAVTAAGLAFLGLTASQASASYTASVQGTTLEVTGNRDSDTLSLLLTSPTTLGVDVGNDGTIDFSFDRSTFDKIHVDGGAGDDEITVSRNGGSLTDEAITLDGGSGNDRLIGSDGAETFNGGSGNDFVDGNIGADTASLGSGNDTFQWDPGDGSDTVDGQDGSDALQFNGSNIGELFDVSANGTRVRFTRNVGAIAMDLGSLERVDVRAIGGADELTVNDLAGTDLKLVDVDESATAGGGDGVKDNIIVNGTNNPDRVSASSPTPGTALISGLATQVQVDNAEPAQDVVTVNGTDGDDTITSGVGVTGPAAIVANGGGGTDTAKYLGSGADDDMFIAAVGTGIARVGTAASTGIDVSAGTEETTIQALSGNDRVSGQNGISAASHFTIDGGNGDDTLLGGDADDLLLGGSGNDLVDGNRGNDTALMGAGNDTFQWDPGDGSDTVDGESGSDALQFNGSNIGELFNVSANGTRVRFTRNVAAIAMDLGGLERTNVRALGGADELTVDNLAGTGMKLVDVDEGATAGGGDSEKDNVIVNGTDDADRVTATSPTPGQALISGLAAKVQVDNAEASQDLVTVDGLAGDDTVNSDVTVTGPAAVVANGGPGTDTARYSGTAGDDQVFIAAVGTGVARAGTATSAGLDVSAGTEETLIQTLGANDTVSGQNGTAAASHFTIDGGEGEDTLSGGDGDDKLIGGSGDDFVDGNRGNDTAVLGSGNDHFQWDPGDGSDTVDGQGDHDTLDFNGSNIGEIIDVFADGGRGRLTRNVAAITMDFDNLEDVSVRALAGNDQILVDDLRGTDVGSVDVDLGASGGGGDGLADVVEVAGSARRDRAEVRAENGAVVVIGPSVQTTITNSEPALDTLEVNTLAGNDDVTVLPDVKTLIQTLVDLGTDE